MNHRSPSNHDLLGAHWSLTGCALLLLTASGCPKQPPDDTEVPDPTAGTAQQTTTEVADDTEGDAVAPSTDGPQREPLAASTLTPKPGCEAGGDKARHDKLLTDAPAFANPPVWDFTAGPKVTAELHVRYEEPTLAGCKTKLRQYAGPKYDERPVAPTMRIRPGQIYRALIKNQLPEDDGTDLDVRMHHKIAAHEIFGGHGGHSTVLGYVPPEETNVNHNVPGNFNVTNLHTHGWHVDPTGNGDNIFAAIGPGKNYRQRIDLPKDHVAGTFWYHAHLHGSTTIQVSSGMAGALMVVDPSKGLDAIPEIRDAVDNLFVLQQLAYDEEGKIESYDNLQQRGYGRLNRPVFVNGQAYPVVQAKVGEVQRWRFVHAGITDPIQPMLVADATATTPKAIPVQEIALDGLPTGKLTSQESLTLAPGYRVDVLAQLSDVKVGDRLFIVDSGQKPLNDAKQVNYRYILAQIEIVAGTPKVSTLPSAAAIEKAKADYVYGTYKPDSKDPYEDMGPLNDVVDQELTTGKHQLVHFYASKKYECPEQGGSCSPCLDEQGNLKDCDANERVYMTCDGKDSNNRWSCMNFNSSADYARTLALDTASRWEVSGAIEGTATQSNHTFHIHVNPFQVQRKFVDGSTGARGEEWVWKDTLKTPTVVDTAPVVPAVLKSRYTRFTGAFVQHCHVLNHEDQGMMQVVEVRPSAADLREQNERVVEQLRAMAKRK